MKTALYARYSTDRQREASIADQFRECERVAAANGLEVVARFSDEGISGGTAARPGYQALLTAARAGEFTVIVTEDLSRLWRNRSEYGQRSAEFEDRGLRLITGVGDDSSRDGYGLILGIKAAIAEHQRREISYRTRRGMEGLARAGKSTGGRCYGYGSGEADIVRRIFAAAASGATPLQIAKALNRDGVPAPRSARWSLNAAKRVLRNPRYAGRLSWGLTVAQGGARDSRSKRHPPRPEGPLVTRDIIPLVNKDLWWACNPGRDLV